MGFDGATGRPSTPPEQLSRWTNRRRHVFREIGRLDLGLSANRLAIPMDEANADLRVVDGPWQTLASAAHVSMCNAALVPEGTLPLATPGLTMPRVLSDPRPSYTRAAVSRRASGRVGLEVLIDEKGKPRVLCVSEPLDPDLDREAIKAVGKWKFEPATLAGRPVPVVGIIFQGFELD